MKLVIESKQNKCELSLVEYEMGFDSLQFTYLFKNLSHQTVFLFNRLYQTSRDGIEIDSNLCYIELEDDQIIISKEIKEVPQGVSVFHPINPFVHRVPVGTAFQETLTLSLPLKYWTEYTIGPTPQLSEKASQHKAFFEIGYFGAPPEGENLIQEIKSKEGPIYFFDPFSPDDQERFRVGPLPQSVPILLPL